MSTRNLSNRRGQNRTKSRSVNCSTDGARSRCSQIFTTQTISRDTGSKVAPFDSSVSLFQALRLKMKLRSYFKENIEQSKFDVGRGAYHYDVILRVHSHSGGAVVDSLASTLSRLDQSSHVVDLGAGTFQFINDVSSNALAPNFTGITMTDLSGHYEGHGGREIKVPKREDLLRNSKVNAIEGKYFEEVPNAEITSNFGQADLVIDLYGVLTYSMNLGLAIEKVAAVLKPGGDLWLATDKSKIHIEEREVSLTQFLVEIGLFEIVATNEGQATINKVSHLQRTSKGFSKLDLRLRDFEILSIGGSPRANWVLRKPKK